MFKFKHTPGNRGQRRIAPQLKPVPSNREEAKKQNYLILWVILLLGAGFTVYTLTAGDKGSPTVINEDGEEVLSPRRKAKLDRELDELDHAVQYVLFATSDGYYPCYTCPDGSPSIFLYEGEVWKYGVTRKGERKRYPGENYGAPNLSYIEQYEGTFGECLKMEKIMIYNYPLLPESRRRVFRLFRPPGNKNDN